MYGHWWLQGTGSTVESRLLRVVLDRVAVRARHRLRTPVTVAVGETSFRDLTAERPPTVLGRLIEDGAVLLDAAVAAHRASGRAAAARLRALAAFARHRPAGAFDRAPGELGAASAQSRAARPAVLTNVSEWAVDEVATRLHLTSHAAQTQLVLAVTLDEQLPATLTALAGGRIGERHAAVLADLLPLLTDPAVRAQVEARLLARVGSKTPSQLQVAARRAVLRADATAAVRRAAAAVRERGVRLYPGRDGTDSLSLTHAGPVARACYDALERYAEACRPQGDPRTKQQRMADCLADLILRPGETGLPPVQAQLTITTPASTLTGGDAPGEVDGDPLPAEVIREIAYALGLLSRPDEGTAGDSADIPDDGNTTEDAAVAETASTSPQDDRRRPALADLLLPDRIAGTALAARPQVAITHPLTGALLALTDAPALRRGDRIGPPAATPGYRPAADVERFVRARDRRCRFPGCRARPRQCDLDHQIPYSRGGPISPCNLCCLCEHHHRLSHQAPGWAMTPMPDGGIRWTLPGGHRLAPTHPPTAATTTNHPTNRSPQRPEPSRTPTTHHRSERRRRGRRVGTRVVDGSSRWSGRVAG